MIIYVTKVLHFATLNYTILLFNCIFIIYILNPWYPSSLASDDVTRRYKVITGAAVANASPW